MEKEAVIINERMKKIRLALGLSQDEFGQRLGISKSGVSDIESGRRKVTDQHIVALRALNVNESWLRDGSGEMFLQSASALDALALEYGLTDSDRIMIEKFVSLRPWMRSAIVEFVRSAAAALVADVDPLSVEDAEALYKRSSRSARIADSSASSSTSGADTASGSKNERGA